jgi:Cu2+-exporting ATPase
MLPILPAALAGGALVLGLRAAKPAKQQLVNLLTGPQAVQLPQPADAVGALVQTATNAAAAYLTALDEQVQQAVQRYLDPLLSNQVRRDQMAVLAAGRTLELSEIEREVNRNLAIGLGALAMVGVANLTGLPLIPLVVATGIYLTIPWYKIAWRILVHRRKLSVAHLMVLYFTGMWLGGYYIVGAIGMVLASFSRKVMIFAENTMHHNLVTIFGEQPRQVWVVVDGMEVEIPFAELKAGDTLVLDVSQMIPIDGTIVQGSAAIDQRMLTGESQPAEKGVGDPVQAATVVLRGRIYVRVEKTGADTTAAQIGEILNRTTEQRLAMEQRAIAIAEKSLWPMVAAGAVAIPLAGFSGALAILGSNFVINLVPLRLLTMLNFLNSTSRHGILVKQADALEQMKTLNAVVFDKTGTLTLERPQVVQTHVTTGWSSDQVLTLAAAAEHRQSHPIAQAILAAAAEQQLTLPPIAEAQYEIGYGIQVQLVGEDKKTRRQGDKESKQNPPLAPKGHPHHSPLVRVGSLRYMQMEGIAIGEVIGAVQEACRENGHSLVFVAVDDELAGAIELQATIRPEAKEVVQALQQRGLDLYIISGDHEAPTRQLAGELGIPHYFAGVLPERKAELVAQLQQEGHKVCFIGDGINDAIALRQADVSISLRGATTAATDTAQIVLMDADLDQLDTLFRLAEALDKNISLNFNVAAALSLLSGAGILFAHLSFAAVEVLAAAQLATGVGIASQPLLTQARRLTGDKVMG